MLKAYTESISEFSEPDLDVMLPGLVRVGHLVTSTFPSREAAIPGVVTLYRGWNNELVGRQMDYLHAQFIEDEFSV